jgi:hypothetical protein
VTRRSLDSFKSWRHVTFQAASDVQQLADIARRFDADDLVDEADALLIRFMERRFTLAVLGEFKRGKSTFINALLGAEVLPADILPTTATVNRVTFGLRPAVELHFHDEERPPEAVPVDALSATVTKLTEGSGAVAATIREAVVSWPVRFCKNDVDIVDTPGLSDEAAMTTVTMRLLPEVDAAIFVVMADSPFSETEGRFLDEVFAAGVARVVYVVNAIDRIRRVNDRARLLDAVRDRIRARVSAYAASQFRPNSTEHAAFLDMHGEIQVHGVSALDALDGAENNDGELISGSGMPHLESALETLLTQSDQLSLLRRCEQVESLAHRVRDAGSIAIAGPAGSIQDTVRRTEVIVDALEPALERRRREIADRLRLAMSKLAEESSRRWSSDLPSFMRKALAECQQGFLEAWPAEYDRFAREAAQKLVEYLTLFVAEIGATRLRGLAEARTPALAQVGPALAGADYVLDFVESRLADHHVSTESAPSIESTPAPDPDPADLAERMALPREAIEAALIDPALVEELEAASNRDGFSRFLSMDFASLPETWASKSRARLLPILQNHFDQNGAETVVSGWIGTAVLGASRPIDARAERARKARLTMHALIERSAARRSSDQARRLQDVALAEGIADRARRNAAQLRSGPSQ